MTDLIAEATQYQQTAADPASSVFVSANAGTGKTKVLTDRVLRLLISGARPETILCMTFTKAAAVEMSVRLNRRLAEWAVCDETSLLKSLSEMGEIRPTQEQIGRARALFAEILDTDDGPRIETVHSFCQSILSRFPIEANIPPHFEMATDGDVESLLAKCLREVVEIPGPLAGALSFVAGYADERQLFAMIKSAMSERSIMRAAIDEPGFMERFRADMKSDLGAVDAPPDAAAFLAGLDFGLLAQLADHMALGGKIQQGRSANLKSWLKLPENAQRQTITDLQALFKGKRLTDKAVDKAVPESADAQKEVAHKLDAYIKASVSGLTFQKSDALMQILVHIFKRYQALKYAQGKLDFNDLIEVTDKMLGRGQMMDWVRWKLDSGINHLLLDEAQDTSPTQWSLIAKLAYPFFEDEPDADLRTVFAVGDFKQSIYRFQGANPDVFLDQRQAFQKLARTTNKPMKTVQFSASFRSASAILRFVDTVLSDVATTGIGSDKIEHKIVRADAPSFVEICPVQRAAKPVPPPPFLPSRAEDIEISASKQADFMADKIADLLASGTNNQLGRIIQPKDIMILVSKRDLFYALLRGALVRKQIPLAPADRVKLINQIEILDLLALGDVCLMPDDDLQLAALLKSPLFGLDDDDLMALAMDRRPDQRLFERLLAHQAAATKLGNACDKLLAWRDRADWQNPFDFFSHILIAEGGRKAFYQRLGSGVIDTLDVFLSLARDHGQQGGTGLQGFLRQIRDTDLELKRDMADLRDDHVRVMTIHGAKGLEAPILILPDMLKPKRRTDLLTTNDTYLYWSHTINDVKPDFIEKQRGAGGEADNEELDRLLYVALTRAENGLIIGGFEDPHRRYLKGSWYERLDQICRTMSDAEELADGGVQLLSGQMQTQTDKLGTKQPSQPDPAQEGDGLPDWFHTSPPVDIPLTKPLNPSQPVPTDIRASAVGADAKSARLHGQIIHELLEWLPDVETQARSAVLEQYLDQKKTISEDAKTRIKNEILQLLQQPEMADLFGPDALCEVPVVGIVDAMPVSGQIDRLCIGTERIIIADFKTGHVPTHESDIRTYHRQLALYGELISQIYPSHQIDSYIVWTRTSNMMLVSAEDRQAALALLREEMLKSAS